MKYFFSILILASIFFNSCKKENEIEKPIDTSVQTKNAILDFTGYYATDGCEFVVEIESIRCKATNEEIFPDSLISAEDINIIIKYQREIEKINNNCGDTPQAWNAITIHSFEIQ